MDGAVVLKCSRRRDGIAERLPLVEQTAVFHAISESYRMWYVVLVVPGDGGAGLHANRGSSPLAPFPFYSEIGFLAVRPQSRYRATPAAKRNVIATNRRRFWKELAK